MPSNIGQPFPLLFKVKANISLICDNFNLGSLCNYCQDGL